LKHFFGRRIFPNIRETVILRRHYEKTLSSNAYIKISEGRLKIDRGIWPVILLKLKSLHQGNKDY
jgi:hypothetical protein